MSKVRYTETVSFKTADIPADILDGRTIQQFNKDCNEYETFDGKPLKTEPNGNKPEYITNGLNTKFVKIIVESKYSNDKEITAFVGGMYNKDGKTKRFEAKFLLNEEIEVPYTMVPILKQAKVARKVRSQDGRSSEIKHMQKFIVTIVE